jgi:sulfate transport system permease protein
MPPYDLIGFCRLFFTLALVIYITAIVYMLIRALVVWKRKEPKGIAPILIIVSLLFLAVFLALPLWTIFSQAFSKGYEYYLNSIAETDALAAIKLTLLIAAIAVPMNAFFGVMLAWAIAKFDFFGKNALITLIEVPFAVSPIVAGLAFILLFGDLGWFGPSIASWNENYPEWLHRYLGWLFPNLTESHPDLAIKIAFALPAMVMATAFVTFPFVARTLLPLMQELGKDDEEAALTLGAGGLQTFFRVTLPNIKWGLLYGAILTNARAMGEFGAVAIVSGLIRGKTMTMPLHIEVLYNEYLLTSAFAVASLLTALALVTIAIKTILERFIALQRKAIIREG